MNTALNAQLSIKEEKKEDKLDMILSSLNKNLETIAKHVGGANQPILKTVDGHIYTSQQNYQKPIPPRFGPDGKRLPPPMVPIPRHLVPEALGGTAKDELGEV